MAGPIQKKEKVDTQRKMRDTWKKEGSDNAEDESDGGLRIGELET